MNMEKLDALKRQGGTAFEMDVQCRALLERAWAHSPFARSGCALSLCEILFTPSQRVQISGQLVPQDPTDEPASVLLDRICSARQQPGDSQEKVRR